MRLLVLVLSSLYSYWCIIDMLGFDETFSDHCMTELVQKREGRSVCEVSEQCLTGMFETGHQEYIILHQILYIMLAREVLQCCKIC